MINCPIDEIMLCSECRHNYDDKCWWFSPARELKEILTVEERLEMKPSLEPKWTISQWDALNQLKSEVRGWRQKHAEALLAIDKLKKQAKEQPF